MARQMVSMELIEEIPIKGVSNPEEAAFHSVAIRDDGVFYLSDEFNHRIIVISPSGEFIRAIGTKGNAHGQFWYPRGLAIVQNGPAQELVVCDAWNHRIQRFGMDGVFIASFGSIGGGKGQFDEPVAVIADKSAIWVLDRCNHRVKKHSLDGELLTQFGNKLGVANEETINDPADTVLGDAQQVRGLNFPMSFTRLGSGSFLIADTNNRRIVKFAPNGTAQGFLKLDVNGKPPYSYPLIVTELGEDLVLFKSVNSAFQLADTSDMWISDETCLNGALINASAVSAYHGKDGAAQLIIADGEKLVISRYKLSVAPRAGRSSPPQSFPVDDELADTPNGWTELGRGRWLSYLKEGDGGQQWLATAKAFLETSKKSAMSVATKLNNVEGKMFQALVRRYDFMEESRMLKKKGVVSSDPAKQANWEMVQLKASQQTRVALRHMLAGDLKGICVVLNGKNGEELSRERADFLELFKSEYNLRCKDHSDVVDYLREMLSLAQNISIPAAIHSLAVIAFLLDHVKLITHAIKKLDMAFIPNTLDEERNLFDYLAPYRTDRIQIADVALSLISQICEKWGFYESARSVLQHGVGYDDLDARQWHVIHLYDLMLRHGELNDALTATLLPFAREVNSQSIAQEFVKRFQDTGEFSAAKELIERFSPPSSGEPALKQRWTILSRVQHVLEKKDSLSVFLNPGQSVAEAFAAIGKEPPAIGGGFRYVTSLALTHPTTGAPVRPIKVVMAPGFGVLLVDTDGFLYLSQEGPSKLKLLFNEPGLAISGFEMINETEALLIMIPATHLGSTKSNGLRIFNLKTGKARDCTGEFTCALPDTPFVITSCGAAGFVVGGLQEENEEGNPILWLMNSDFTQSKPLAAPNGRIGHISVHNSALVVSYWLRDLIFRVNLQTGEPLPFSSDYCVAPTGVAHGADGLLFVTNVRGLGLQAYASEGDIVFQVVAVRHKNAIYQIECGGLSRKPPYLYAGGDLALSDYNNGRIHIFNTAD